MTIKRFYFLVHSSVYSAADSRLVRAIVISKSGLLFLSSQITHVFPPFFCHRLVDMPLLP